MLLPPFDKPQPHYLKVGHWTYAGRNFRIDHFNPLQPRTCTIGRFCCIADDVTIMLSGEHRTEYAAMFHFPKYLVSNTRCEEFIKSNAYLMTKGDVVIGNDVWLGYRTTILSGVTIGNGAVIAAGAVVVKDVKPYEIVGGVPAKLIRMRHSDEQIKEIEKIRWWQDWDDETILARQEDLMRLPIDEFINKYKVSGS